MTSRNPWLTVAALSLAVLSLTAAPAQAVVILDLTEHITSSPSEFSPILPAGSPPWATATFAQNGANTVRLTMAANLQDDLEFISAWLFNFNPAKDASLLVESFVASESDIEASSFNSSGSPSGNFIVGDGGRYDIRFNFSAASGSRLEGMLVSVYDLMLPGLLETDFDFFSEPQGAHDLFKSAAHVQGVTFEDSPSLGSAWIGAENPTPPIPEPSTVILLGLGLAGLGLFARRKSAK